ncbi:protease HtpX [Candidatus Blochmannia ocreatus (nom. nud.)]|uniref:Protease HtpX n=1 Tax=Candidatus Blochmannia ocreatus (nom. nud.) TaxID=251538 RepID=A0ABY4SSJ4_9ENTR|nr:protease HtpX [Candidatus Blochmannia ocreatus]URJ24947.1 protease HtpX [Candidatus Blochmannia ocreatus]
MMRIMLFIVTNLLVMILFGSVLSCIGNCSSSTFELIKIASIFGFLGAFISLLLSKFIALSTVNGVVINKASNDMEIWILESIRNQSKKLCISAPQLAIYDSVDMNAFATGFRKNAALIAVSSSLLKNMSRDSIEAVIAHEISHIASGDMVTMTLIQGVMNTFVIFISRSLSRLIEFCLLYNSDRNSSISAHDNDHYNFDTPSLIYVVITSILEMLFGMLASIVVFWFSRRREFYADSGAAKLVGCKNMICALQELQCDIESNNISNSVMTLYINSVKKTNILSNLFASHPSLEHRIEALRNGTYF